MFTPACDRENSVWAAAAANTKVKQAFCAAAICVSTLVPTHDATVCRANVSSGDAVVGVGVWVAP